VRHATLAPSSHSTQCWKFPIEVEAIAPDLSRRCPAVVPDDRHLFDVLGCASENLVQAALAHGLTTVPSFDAARATSVAPRGEAFVASERCDDAPRPRRPPFSPSRQAGPPVAAPHRCAGAEASTRVRATRMLDEARRSGPACCGRVAVHGVRFDGAA
jgi:hypothetical protein